MELTARMQTVMDEIKFDITEFLRDIAGTYYTYNTIVHIIDEYLYNLKEQGSIQDWQVLCDERNNPPTSANTGYLNIGITYTTDDVPFIGSFYTDPGADPAFPVIEGVIMRLYKAPKRLEHKVFYCPAPQEVIDERILNLFRSLEK